MRKTMAVAGIVVAFVAGVVTVSLAGRAKVASPMKIKVVEHADTDVVVDVGAPGASTGDLLTFHNDLYDRTNTTKVGHDQGECVRISPADGTWECRWIAWLDGMGALTVEGSFNDNHGTVLAITGGTGIFRNARGTMQLGFRADPAEFNFIYRVVP